MDLDGVRLLLRVVAAGSVQRAAEQAGLPRSSMRRKLDDLEARVGCELFVRSTTGVALTPAGTVVLEEGRALLEHYERMVATARSARTQPGGKIVVVVPVGMPDVVRVMLFQTLHATSPDLRMEEVERPDPLDHLHEPFDLMFHVGDPPERGEWFSRTMLRTPLVPVASQAYLDARGRPQTPGDLARHDVLAWRKDRSSPTAWPLRAGGAIEVDPIFCSHSGQLVHRMAQAGLGILLGNPDPALLDAPTPLVPVLEGTIGGELVMRCLSPLPGTADPRTRPVLESIQAFVARIATD